MTERDFEAASLEAFNAARRQAFIQDILAELSGRSPDLLSFDLVRNRLHLNEPASNITLQEIPLDKIVGSVGRYHDFNRAFLPRTHVDPRRWARIAGLQGRINLPPIEVFKVGDVYFVRDGHHRVSVARVRKQRTIRAQVAEIPIRVPLEPDTSPDDLLLKADYADFLEQTALDQLFPDQKIELTQPGGYYSLLQQIEIHQFYMGLRSRHYPTLQEATAEWYRDVYLPLVERIRASGILRHFHGRTEADLFLWITENRARLQTCYTWRKNAQEIIREFAMEHRQPILSRWFTRLRRWLSRLTPRPGRKGSSSPP
ncbi:MAG: hypothetical protein ACUVWZ_03485 [Anaerolineae bacterium]